MLQREEILQAGLKLAGETIEIPAWGGPVRIREMTGREREEWEDKKRGVQDDQEGPQPPASGLVRAWTARYSVCDETGKLLFTDDDVPALAEGAAAALDLVFEAALRINKLRKIDAEELSKNSASRPPAGDESSDSRSDSAEHPAN
jgi:hypothetical protein